jgi:peptidyl-prolyl cis-trans isomerase D
VAGVKISSRQLDAKFRRNVANVRTQLGGQFDTQQAIQMGMVRQTLDGLIEGRLMGLEAKRLGLDAGDDLVRRTIREDAGFRNRANRFDAAIFRQFLERQNMTEAGFVESLRGRIARSQMLGAIVAGSTVPKALTDLMYAFRNERRNASVVRIRRGAAAGIADPGAGAVAEYHRTNAAAFTAPEYRRITVVHLDPEAMAAEIRPSEQRLREEYKARLPALSVPERRQLQQILVRDEALARKVHRMLKEGRAFADTATQIAKVKASSLDLGNLRKADLPAALSEVAFGLNKGGIGAPVRTPLGWHILRVVKIDAGKAPRFEEVRKRIASDIGKEEAVDALIAVANRFQDALAGGAALDDAAARASATPRRIAAIAANGTDASGKMVAKLPQDAGFLETVFTAATGQLSPLLETQDGGFYMVRVESVTPPALRPLGAVRKEVIAAWKVGQMDRAAKARAEALLADARRRGSLAAAAKAKGLVLETGKPFSRFIRDPASPVPATLVGALFRVKRGGMVMAPDEDGFTVGVLTDIEAVRPEQNKKEYEAIRKALRQSMSSDLVAQYSAALRSRYPVTVNQAAVDSLF